MVFGLRSFALVSCQLLAGALVGVQGLQSSQDGLDYRFYPGKALPGKVLRTLDSLVGDLQGLADACAGQPFCVAFNTRGELIRGTATAREEELVDAEAPLGSSDGVWLQVVAKIWGGYKLTRPTTAADLERVAMTHAVHEALLDALVEVRAGGGLGAIHLEALQNSLSDDTDATSDTNGTISGIRFGLQALGAANELPVAWDSRTSGRYNLVAPVRDQGKCGTCMAFSGTAVAESAWAQVMAQDASTMPRFSPQAFYFCNRVSTDKACSAGMADEDVLEVPVKDGFQYEACFPYKGKTLAKSSTFCSQPQCTGPTGPAGKWESIDFFNEYETTAEAIIAIKKHIIKWGAVIAPFDANDDLDNYASGVISQKTIQDDDTAHAVAVVGYNDTGRYWICKNSWGPAWGEQGYFKMAYGFKTYMLSGADDWTAMGYTYTPAAAGQDTPTQQQDGGVDPGRVEVPSPSPPSPNPPSLKPPSPPPSDVRMRCELEISTSPSFGRNRVSTVYYFPGEGQKPVSLPAYEDGWAVYDEDMSQWDPSWGQVTESFQFRCTCNGTGSCYSLAQDMGVMMWNTTFGDYGPDTPVAQWSMKAGGATKWCQGKLCGFTATSSLMKGMEGKAMSLAITYRWDEFTPDDVGEEERKKKLA